MLFYMYGMLHVKLRQSSYLIVLGTVAQWAASPFADPGVAGSIPAQPYTFVEINHEVFSMVIHSLIQERLLSVAGESILG